MTAPVAADVFASDLVAVQFDQQVLLNTDSLDPASYSIAPTGGGAAMTVRSVFAGSSEDPTDILYLVVSQGTVDEKYTVTVADSIVGEDGDPVLAGTDTAQFVYRKTKVDNILGGPRLYSKVVTSIYRNVLTAIGREDDLIGGSRSDDLPAFPTSVFVPPEVVVPPVITAGYESRLWYPPATPHALDDEFEGADLNDYTLYDTAGNPISWSGTEPSIYDTAFTTGDPRYVLDRRTSWLILQSKGDASTEYMLSKALTGITDDFTIYARVRITASGNDADEESRIGIFIAADDGGGAPDPNNYGYCTLTNYNGGGLFNGIGYRGWGRWFSGGSLLGGAMATNGNETPIGGWGYVAIHWSTTGPASQKRWVGWSNGAHWNMSNTSDPAWTPAHFGVYFGNTGNGGGIRSTVGIDFVRVIEDTTFLL